MKIRAYDKDGNEVVGWYFRSRTTEHYMVREDAAVYDPDDACGHITIDHASLLKIDISTAAEDTGKDASNGRIFGSRGEMKGGDRVRLCNQGGGVPVVWNRDKLLWGFPQGGELGCWLSDELEIIPKEEK